MLSLGDATSPATGLRNLFGMGSPKFKLQSRGDASIFCSPALKVAAAKILEEMVAVNMGTHGLRVVAVVVAEAGALKVQLHLARRSPVAPSLGLR